MVSNASLAEVAALVGDPARAGMLTALMDGRALTATELAHVAGIAPQTASGHLARLSTAGLLTIEKQGRHRYHRLASQEVARMVEGLMHLAATVTGKRLKPTVVGPRDQALRTARTCYDHLAGRLGVAIADSMIRGGLVEIASDGGIVTESGVRFLKTFGIGTLVDVSARSRSRRPFCRPCLDWSERRPHLAGVIGAAIFQCCLERGWLKRIGGTRALNITPLGLLSFRETFEIELERSSMPHAIPPPPLAQLHDEPARAATRSVIYRKPQ